MEGIAAISGLFSLILGLFLLIVGILMLLLPFFVLRIRNEAIEINKKLTQLLDSTEHPQEKKTSAKTETLNSGKKVKICPSCGAKNRLEDPSCLNCKSPMP